MNLFQMVKAGVPVEEVKAALAEGLPQNPPDVVSFFTSAREAFHYFSDVFELPEVQKAWRNGGGNEVRVVPKAAASASQTNEEGAPPGASSPYTGAKGETTHG